MGKLITRRFVVRIVMGKRLRNLFCKGRFLYERMQRNFAAPERISFDVMIRWNFSKESYCNCHVWEYEGVGDNVDWFEIQVFELQWRGNWKECYDEKKKRKLLMDFLIRVISFCINDNSFKDIAKEKFAIRSLMVLVMVEMGTVLWMS